MYMTEKDQYVNEEIERMRHTELSCLEVINNAQVGCMATDITEVLLGGPDIVMGVLEDLLDYRSIIVEMVCILQVSRHHHREIIFFCEQVQSLERILYLRLS